MPRRDRALGTRPSGARRRAGIVVVDEGRVALIRRRRDGLRYHLFPGGGVEAGETDEDAAIREAHEELGVRVEIVRLLGTVVFGTSTQVYFEARVTGGTFGTGTGSEMTSPPASASGSYEPIWLPIAELGSADVRPAALASMLVDGRLASSPFEIVET